MFGSLGGPEVLIIGALFFCAYVLPFILLWKTAAGRGQSHAHVLWGLLGWPGVLIGLLMMPQQQTDHVQRVARPVAREGERPDGPVAVEEPPSVRSEQGRISDLRRLQLDREQRQLPPDTPNAPGSNFATAPGRGTGLFRHRRLGLIIGAVVFGGVVLLVIALGIVIQASSDDEPPLQTLAMTVNDFPSGWRERIESGGDADDDPAKACDASAPHGEKARVQTGYFYDRDESVEVWQTVVSFGSVAEADATVGRARDWGACLVDAIQSGAFDDGETSFSEASFDAVQLPQVGRRSEAYMFTVTATGDGEAVVTYLAVVYFSVGKRASALFMFTVGAPPDNDFLQAVVLRAAAKLGERTGKELPPVAANQSKRPEIASLKAAATETAAPPTATPQPNAPDPPTAIVVQPTELKPTSAPTPAPTPEMPACLARVVAADYSGYLGLGTVTVINEVTGKSTTFPDHGYGLWVAGGCGARPGVCTARVIGYVRMDGSPLDGTTTVVSEITGEVSSFVVTSHAGWLLGACVTG